MLFRSGLRNDIINLFVIDGLSSLKDSIRELQDEFKVTINVRQLSEADYRKLKKDMPDDMRAILEGEKVILVGRL